MVDLNISAFPITYRGKFLTWRTYEYSRSVTSSCQVTEKIKFPRFEHLFNEGKMLGGTFQDFTSEDLSSVRKRYDKNI